MMIGMALFWGVIILGLVWLVRDGLGRHQPDPEETALAILDRRFAEGALSPEDYQERKGVLTGAAAPRPDQNISSEETERSKR
jgi:putative membrane protein